MPDPRPTLSAYTRSSPFRWPTYRRYLFALKQRFKIPFVFKLRRRSLSISWEATHLRSNEANDRDERNRLGIKGLNQLFEVSKRSGEAVDLVDHYYANHVGLDVSEQSFEGRALEVAAGNGCVVVRLIGEDFSTCDA